MIPYYPYAEVQDPPPKKESKGWDYVNYITFIFNFSIITTSIECWLLFGFNTNIMILLFLFLYGINLLCNVFAFSLFYALQPEDRPTND